MSYKSDNSFELGPKARAQYSSNPAFILGADHENTIQSAADSVLLSDQVLNSLMQHIDKFKQGIPEQISPEHQTELRERLGDIASVQGQESAPRFFDCAKKTLNSGQWQWERKHPKKDSLPVKKHSDSKDPRTKSLELIKTAPSLRAAIRYVESADSDLGNLIITPGHFLVAEQGIINDFGLNETESRVISNVMLGESLIQEATALNKTGVLAAKLSWQSLLGAFGLEFNGDQKIYPGGAQRKGVVQASVAAYNIFNSPVFDNDPEGFLDAAELLITPTSTHDFAGVTQAVLSGLLMPGVGGAAKKNLDRSFFSSNGETVDKARRVSSYMKIVSRRYKQIQGQTGNHTPTLILSDLERLRAYAEESRLLLTESIAA